MVRLARTITEDGLLMLLIDLGCFYLMRVAPTIFVSLDKNVWLLLFW